jgi:hypothetical protein
MLYVNNIKGIIANQPTSFKLTQTQVKMETRSKSSNKEIVQDAGKIQDTGKNKVKGKKVKKTIIKEPDNGGEEPDVNCEIFKNIKQRFDAIKLKHKEIEALEKSLSEEVIMLRSIYFRNSDILNTNRYCECGREYKRYVDVKWYPYIGTGDVYEKTTRDSSITCCTKCKRIHIGDIKFEVW